MVTPRSHTIQRNNLFLPVRVSYQRDRTDIGILNIQILHPEYRCTLPNGSVCSFVNVLHIQSASSPTSWNATAELKGKSTPLSALS